MRVIINFLIALGRPILRVFKVALGKINIIKNNISKLFIKTKFKTELWFSKYKILFHKLKSKFKSPTVTFLSTTTNKLLSIKENKRNFRFNFLKNLFRKKEKLINLDDVYKANKFKFGWKWPTLLLITLSITGILLWMYQVVVKGLPNVNDIYNPPKLSTKIYDRNDNLLYQFYDDEDRSWVPLSEIPQDLVMATLAIEDKDFYKHHGFSIRGIFQAIIYNFKKNGDDKPRGGSTITQQLVKNVFLTNEKSFERKAKEAALTVMLENKLSKNEILERYFNQVPYGGNIYGIAAAANRYLNKDIKDLNLAEAAFLAGLPAAPGSYSPFNTEGFRLAKLRQEHVLNEMQSLGFINSESAEKTKKIEIKIVTEKKDILAPHFVFYVKSYLEKLGFTEVERRGLKVKTSLDLDIQKNAEGIVKEEINKASRLKISNGASLVLDVKTGDILAMVGSKDYFATDINGKFDVVTQGLRQPGSSIKPINYLLALEKGKNLWETIDDNPVSYKIPGQKAYTPQNYTGKYLGTVTLKTALASSLNIPSVKLLNENGVENMIDLAELMGITTWNDRSRFGLSLALGAGEVKMIEMAQAYSIFANLGNKVEINPILEINNYLGEKIYQKSIQSEKVLDEKNTFLIDSALSDDLARSPIFGLNSMLHISGKTVAVKTGTTNSLKDNWCIGWTPSYLVTAWVGNNDSSPMSWVASGISGATPIWNRIMKSLIADKKDENWPTPDGLYRSDACGKSEWFFSGGEKNVKCVTPTVTPTPTN